MESAEGGELASIGLGAGGWRVAGNWGPGAEDCGLEFWGRAAFFFFLKLKGITLSESFVVVG